MCPELLVIQRPIEITEKMKQKRRNDMGPSEGYITTDDGIRLFFQKLGSCQKTVIMPNWVFLFDDFKHLGDGRTLIFYDLRNCGRSDRGSDSPKLKRGIHHDVDDLEAVRRHFKITPVAVIGHSYLYRTQTTTKPILPSLFLAPVLVSEPFLITPTPLNLHKRLPTGGSLQTAVSDAPRRTSRAYLHCGAHPIQH